MFSQAKFTICVDTNAYHTDYFLKNPALNILINKASMGSGRFAIAEVTLQELQSHYRKDLAESIEKINAANRILKKLRTMQPEYALADLDKEIDEYDANLRIELDNREVSVIPLTSMDHSEILDHMKRGKRPFTGDSGYKDFLLFQAFISAIIDGVPTLFVTNDNDFYLGQKPHPDILEQIVKAGNSIDDVHFFKDLRAASEWLSTELGIADAPQRPVPSPVEVKDKVDFQNVIDSEIQALTGAAMYDVEHDLVFFDGEGSEIEFLNISSISPASEDYWYCEFDFEISILVSGLDRRYLQMLEQPVPDSMEISATIVASVYLSVDDWTASGFELISIDATVESP